MRLYNKILNKSQDDKKTLIVIYYAGHGLMVRNENKIVVQEKTEDKYLYNLEFQSQALSKIENSYILTIFDCCREYQAPYAKENRGSGNGGNGNNYDD